MGILSKLIISSVIITASNAIIGFSLLKNNQKLLESEDLVRHTEQVISLSGNIHSLAKDIESAARGFVITNDSTFLGPLVTAEITIFSDIGKLRELTLDNPSQVQLVDSLQFYMQKRLRYSMKAVEIRSDQGLEQAVAFIATMQGFQYSERLRQLTNSIQKAQNLLLIRRKATNDRSVSAFTNLIIILFILMAVFTLLLLLFIGNTLYQNKEREKRAAELILANIEVDFQHEEKVKQEAANKELEAFSYSVSHDLRAPLRHIGGFIELLKRSSSEQLNPAGLRYLNIISESSQEMGKLIDALLTFSRLSRTDLVRTRIDTNKLVANVLETFSDETEGRQVTINVAELPETTGDRELIVQVWTNLISNALKYSRNKEIAIINIGGKIEGKKAIFQISDNGAGFDMQFSDKLFGVFQRLHKSSEFEGIGIGLANVSRIVTRHGGTCRAEGKVDEGAVFFFSIPIVDPVTG